jgi:hypothetical protein
MSVLAAPRRTQDYREVCERIADLALTRTSKTFADDDLDVEIASVSVDVPVLI